MQAEHALRVAREAADAAAFAAMQYFRKGVRVELKPDQTPVTAADRDAEAAILDVLRRECPEHDILSEESGAHEHGSDYRWIIDPLDGTRGFSRGGTFWGPLIALQHGDAILAGAAGLPALGEIYYAARGLGCYRNGQPLHVSRIDTWSKATLSLGELTRLLAPPCQDAVLGLLHTAASARGYGDVAAATLLLNGRAEAWIEAGVQVWDLAPMRVLVEEAGGRMTDFDGGTDLTQGRAIATNGSLHEHVLSFFR